MKIDSSTRRVVEFTPEKLNQNCMHRVILKKLEKDLKLRNRMNIQSDREICNRKLLVFGRVRVLY